MTGGKYLDALVFSLGCVYVVTISLVVLQFLVQPGQNRPLFGRAERYLPLRGRWLKTFLTVALFLFTFGLLFWVSWNRGFLGAE